MIAVRKSSERGHFDHGWLDTYHTFSFGDYYDPQQMSFRALRVINEDFVKGGKGFGLHPHKDMEIITYIVQGELQHKDSLGNGAVIKPGEVQRITAGRGILHSEFNPSPTAPVHLLQIWLTPRAKSLEPSYAQREFPAETRRNRLGLVASPDGAAGSITINQDVRLYASLLDKGAKAELPLAAGRGAWVQVIKGSVDLNGQVVQAGDGAAVNGEPKLTLTASDASELLVFDLA